jgi:anti-sigma regulatory factor (Ser/Thr protein kinase)
VPEPAEFEVWRFPALPNRLAPIRHRLAAWLEENGVEPELRGDLILAVSEACGNAITHAYRDRDGTVVMQVRLDDGKLTIRVSDTGRWLERREPSITGGRGLDIIRALVDDAHVHGTPQGTTVIMQRRIVPPQGSDALAAARPSAACA